MSGCEKCWSDAQSSVGDVAERYHELIAERKATPCTPEQQAGPDATICATCGQRTAHQFTGECMRPDCAGWNR